MMRRIHDRGHEIGYHGSYSTYRDTDRTTREANMLKETAGRLGIEQNTWGGRQHYLRWSAPATRVVSRVFRKSLIQTIAP